MRKLFIVSLILAAIVLSVLMLTGPTTAQASSALPNRLLAAGTATPTPTSRNSFPPSGTVPTTFPPSGGSGPENGAGALLGLGGVLFVAGVAMTRRRKTN